MANKTERKKKNFMIKYEIIHDIEKFIPSGKRSEFVNRALAEAIQGIKNEIAFTEMEKMNREEPLHMTNDEILEAINYGRE